MSRLSVLAATASVAILGCAQGSTDRPFSQDAAVDSPPPVDADGPTEFPPDAPSPDLMPPVDAPVTPPDTMMPPDACVPSVTELLQNKAYDATPLGSGWTQYTDVSTDRLITNEGTTAKHTAPNFSWQGGYAGDDLLQDDFYDELYQDVVVPVGTTQLTLTGYYLVATSDSTTTVYDRADIGVSTTTNVVIQKVRELSNTTAAAAWTPFEHTFTQNLAGQTIRIYTESLNDYSLATSFYFDSMSLTATVACP